MTPLRKEVYYNILDHVKKYGRLPSLGMSKQARNKYVSYLKSVETIRKISKGAWVIDPEKCKEFLDRKIFKEISKGTPQGTPQKRFTIEGHGYQIKLTIPYSNEWGNREKWLKKHKIQSCLKGIRKNTPRIIFGGCKLWLANKSILIYYPKGLCFYGETAKECQRQAIYYAHTIIKKLESLFKYNLSINGEYVLEIFKQHHAHLNDPLAKDYVKNKRRLSVKYNGKEWLIADYSNEPHLETVDSKTSAEDMDNVVMPLYNDLKAHYLKTGERLTLTPLMEALYGVVQNQAYHEANIKAHVDSIKEMNSSLKKLTAVIERLKRPHKDL